LGGSLSDGTSPTGVVVPVTLVLPLMASVTCSTDLTVPLVTVLDRVAAVEDVTDHPRTHVDGWTLALAVDLRRGPRLSHKLGSSVNANAGASLDTGPLSGGLGENVDLLQVLQRLSVRSQGVDTSYDRFVLAWRRDLEMLGEARRDGSCYHTRGIVRKRPVWSFSHGLFERRFDNAGDRSTHWIGQCHGSVGPRHIKAGQGLQVRGERRSRRELLEIEESYQGGYDRRVLVGAVVDQVPGNER
jgi:hypothetical protein